MWFPRLVFLTEAFVVLHEFIITFLNAKEIVNL